MYSFAAAAAAESLQSCPTLQPQRRQPTGLPHPGDSPGKNTGVGCHCLLQSIKVRSESEVTQSCPTLRDLMDCSLPGSFVHGIFQARVLEWGAIAFSTCMFYNYSIILLFNLLCVYIIYFMSFQSGTAVLLNLMQSVFLKNQKKKKASEYFLY